MIFPVNVDIKRKVINCDSHKSKVPYQLGKLNYFRELNNIIIIYIFLIHLYILFH